MLRLIEQAENKNVIIEYLHEQNLSSTTLTESTTFSDVYQCSEMFDHVGAAGTFDRLHADHKIVLSLASAHSRISCIIAVLTVVGGKELPELIEPISVRMDRVQRFMQLFDPRKICYVCLFELTNISSVC